ncbi:2Fe-2S iron-sulfur cluster-binding protein [Gloeobacter violaceus]|uniref:Ferredoxin like protein n=1 Tax=Gloeobacter violaceus (strain ATCC 29082 / PCC 7421) TaxID=251221 RepID=Q7NKF7_GLOVI|nr:2Fe-2S iron-sulfur cluster-binding protein [Gloeobacter violaceus]BAC89462.1 ferredoxin like protein [Gloeobacter violaceus PCC 7421]
MPQVKIFGKTYTCAQGANLRQFLLEQNVPLYNGPSSLINCHGLGTCGTCAVGIAGPVSEPGGREKFRLGLPPHKGVEGGRRLACQVTVLGDIEVTKYEGIWGEGARPVDDRVSAS